MLLAIVSMTVPDRLFLTQKQGLWLGCAFLGVALLRGSRQVGQEIPAEVDALALSRLPQQNETQYMGHGFTWDPQHANEVLAAEREGQALTGSKRRPGDLGGVAALHAVGQADETPVFLPLNDLEGHMLVSGATRTGDLPLSQMRT
jgi:hypothetical protein